jgi:hypothetical protein
MAIYRCYLLDGNRLTIGVPHVIDAPNDAAAISRVREICASNPQSAFAELWLSDRFVWLADRRAEVLTPPVSGGESGA